MGTSVPDQLRTVAISTKQYLMLFLMLRLIDEEELFGRDQSAQAKIHLYLQKALISVALSSHLSPFPHQSLLTQS